MIDSTAAKDRRIAKFLKLLEPMHNRAHLEAEGTCFTIIEERPPDGKSAVPALEQLKLRTIELVQHRPIRHCQFLCRLSSMGASESYRMRTSSARNAEFVLTM